VRLGDSKLVPAAIRGRTLEDTAPTATPLELEPGWAPLASSAEGVLWAASGSGKPTAYRAAVAPEELREGEVLRDLFQAGRFMTLLPLIELIRAAGGAPTTTLRAALMLDDPNLHWTSYGYASYPALARHAQEHGYHIAMGMIPLDGWIASGRAVRLFDGARPWLSLLMHGNDHVHRELAQSRPTAATALLAQALRRVGSFEARTGAGVDRVMAPPHGAYSLASARAMVQVGIQALCANYAAVDAGPSRDDALAGWRAAEFAGGGLPVLPRYHFDEPREELAFRALLGQPLILYGHHQDLARGLGVLAHAAADVNALGDVRWTSIGEIARANYETWQRDGALHVRLFSRRSVVAVPPGVDRLVVEVPGHDSPEDETIRFAGGRSELEGRFDAGSSSFPLEGETTVVLSLAHDGALDPATVPSPRPNPWPVLRRILTESRDRLAPVLPR
jgi:hypothetical protein